METLDATTKTIHCADGTTIHYDAALLATGAAPGPANLPGSHLGNVFLLRSRKDADAILAQAERSERAVILGASFIGMEVAASLRERGLQVTVVGRKRAIREAIGARIGNAFVRTVRKQGVTLRLGQEIQALVGKMRSRR